MSINEYTHSAIENIPQIQPSTGLTENERCSIGIDIGGTKIAGVLVRNNQILESCRIPSRRGNEAVVADIDSVVRTLLNSETGKKFSPTSVGVGIPGRVDHTLGIVRDAVNLAVTELHLGDELSARIGLPVHVENDVNAAALGIAVSGFHKSGTVAFLNVGTGLAAGVIRNGCIDYGSTDTVGEVGHIPVDPNQFPCPCGQRGCLETVTSGSAVIKLWPKAGERAMPSLIECAETHDPEAERILGIVLHGFVTTILILATSIDPDAIVIGGGMAKTGKPLLDAIQHKLEERSKVSSFLTSLHLSARVQLADQSIPAGALGAALAVYQ